MGYAVLGSRALALTLFAAPLTLMVLWERLTPTAHEAHTAEARLVTGLPPFALRPPRVGFTGPSSPAASRTVSFYVRWETDSRDHR